MDRFKRKALLIVSVLLHLGCSQSSKQPVLESRVAGALGTSLNSILTNGGQSSLPAYNSTGKIVPGSGIASGTKQKPCLGRMGRSHPDQGSGNCTGNLYNEIALPTLGMALVHNSLGASLHYGFGLGFNLSADQRFVILSTGKAVVSLGDGSTSFFRLVGTRWLSDDPRIDTSEITVSGTSATQKLRNGLSVTYSRVASDASLFVAISANDTNGNTTTFSRNSVGQLTKITSPFGISIVINYSGSVVSSIMDRANRAYHFTYDASKRLTRLQQPDGRSTTLTYDGGSGRIASITHFDGEVLKYTYYDSGDHESIENWMGYKTYIYYTGTKVVEMNTFERKDETFNSDGALISVTVNKLNSKITRDSLNRVVSITDPEGNSTVFTYDTNDPLPKTQTYPNGGGVRTFLRDSSRRLTADVFQKGNVKTVATFDPALFGLAKAITEGNGSSSTTFLYDTKGNLLEKKRNGWLIAQYTYTPQGLIQTARNASGQVSTFKYNSFGQLETKTNHLGKVTTFLWDGLGNPSTVIGSGLRQTYSYDSLGQIVSSETRNDLGTGGSERSTVSRSYFSSGALSTEQTKTEVGAWSMRRDTRYDSAYAPGNISSDVLTNVRGEVYELGK